MNWYPPFFCSFWYNHTSFSLAYERWVFFFSHGFFSTMHLQRLSILHTHTHTNTSTFVINRSIYLFLSSLLLWHTESLPFTQRIFITRNTHSLSHSQHTMKAFQHRNRYEGTRASKQNDIYRCDFNTYPNPLLMLDGDWRWTTGGWLLDGCPLEPYMIFIFVPVNKVRGKANACYCLLACHYPSLRFMRRSFPASNNREREKH